MLAAGKRCAGCKQSLTALLFARDKGQRDGLDKICRACRAARRRGATHKNIPGGVVFDRPDHCEICRLASTRLCWDHDHETGAHRGWLCGNCNRALGLLKDSAQALQNAVAYLARTGRYQDKGTILTGHRWEKVA